MAQEPRSNFEELMEYLQIHFMPAKAKPFDVISSYAFTAAGTPERTIATFKVPQNQIGVIKWVGQDSDQPAVFNNSTWNLKINGVAVPSWASVEDQKGSVAQPTPETIVLNENDTVTLTCILSTGTDITFGSGTPLVSGRLKGWYWPRGGK